MEVLRHLRPIGGRRLTIGARGAWLATVGFDIVPQPVRERSMILHTFVSRRALMVGAMLVLAAACTPGVSPSPSPSPGANPVSVPRTTAAGT